MGTPKAFRAEPLKPSLRPWIPKIIFLSGTCLNASGTCFASKSHVEMPRINQTPIKKFNFFIREIWVPDPGTGSIRFLSKFCTVW